jgi:hypothetical protein
LEEKQGLENLAEKIDSEMYAEFGISKPTQKQIRQEIFLRTAEDPEDREIPDPESIPEVPENLDEQVKDLVHHFAMEVVRDESDGIIPVEGTGTADSILSTSRPMLSWYSGSCSRYLMQTRAMLVSNCSRSLAILVSPTTTGFASRMGLVR